MNPFQIGITSFCRGLGIFPPQISVSITIGVCGEAALAVAVHEQMDCVDMFHS
jgi:hypothetical protein